MYKILFVCIGATCRSPMAHAMFSHKIRQYNLCGLKSGFAGLNVEYGAVINTKSRVALHNYGISRVCGKPEQINGKHLADYNLIVCMAQDHKEALSVMSASQYLDKIKCVRDFCGFDIPDPYGGSQQTYNECLLTIEKSIDKIIEVLLGNGIAKRK